jgi:hypothetical protein
MPSFSKRKKNRRWARSPRDGSISSGDPVNQRLATTASLVGAYVQHSAVPLTELPALIAAVHFCIWVPGTLPTRVLSEFRKPIRFGKRHMWRGGVIGRGAA